jgi:cytochrome c5
MKYFFSVLVFSSLLLIACNRKAIPDGNTVSAKNQTDKKGKAGAGETTDPSQKKDEVVADPDAEKGKDPVNEPVPTSLPAIPPPSTKPATGEKPSETEMGKVIYNTRCNKCHGSKNVGNYTMAKWESILKTMVPNAKLSGEEESLLIAYIRANAK